jgi:hypothetical protein
VKGESAVRTSQDLIDVRKEIAKFKAEAAQRLDMIEHLLNKHIRLNYMRLIVDYMTQQTAVVVESLDCPKGEKTEAECKDWLANLQQPYVDKLKSGKIGESNKALSESLGAVQNYGKTVGDKNDKACGSCMNKVAKAFEINSSLLRDLNLLASPFSEVQDELEVVNGVNPAKLEADVLGPIAHVARLQIMLSVFQGNCRFADFTRCTSLRGGHLLYHVRKLVEHGFMAKDAGRDYHLTPKGIRVLALLTQLGKEK